MAVRTPSGSEHLVCWVDSKATFGDQRTHVKQVEEQYCTYVNRHVAGRGPGVEPGKRGRMRETTEETAKRTTRSMSDARTAL